MDGFACEECRAIYHELREAIEAARGRRSADISAQTLAGWVEQLDSEDLARIVQTSPFWKPWRRLREHRTRTGHWQSPLAMAPGAMVNRN